ncbi:MAG: hypothetical protein HY873_13290 [Chloroflexi bacterium]|nr:hypothetical protein [Chloroflexota bacterium]
MSALSAAMEAVRTYELSRRPVFAAEPQRVDVEVMPGRASTVGFMACRFCAMQLVVYSAGLAIVGKIARTRGWKYRNGIGWLCPGCEGMG